MYETLDENPAVRVSPIPLPNLKKNFSQYSLSMAWLNVSSCTCVRVMITGKLHLLSPSTSTHVCTHEHWLKHLQQTIREPGYICCCQGVGVHIGKTNNALCPVTTPF